ncbi:hypothetical protein ENBRE01_1327 [Enteropsectra breve]|nr:hypothetical protein ENBRE01_1327 [Enteropsectra breve]
MKLFKEIIPPFMRSGFTPVEFTGPYDEQLSVPVLCNGREATFLLPQLLESAMLNDKLSALYSCVTEKMPSHNAQGNTSECNKATQEPKDNKSEHLHFARLYQTALRETQYHDDDSRYKVIEYIEQWFRYHYPNKLKTALKRSKPVEKLSLDYNHDLMQLIFQMRHQLFIHPKITFTPKILATIFQYYGELDFDKNSVAEIFVEDKDERTAHYKIRCEIVFGLNLHNLLKKADMLDAFKNAVLFKKPEGCSSVTSSKSEPVKKYGENISCFSHTNASDDSYGELIPNNRLPECLGFLKPLFRILRIDHNPVRDSYSTTFVDEIKDMQRVWARRSEEYLYTGSWRYFNPVSFLECFNEKNLQFKNLTHLIVVVSKKPVAGQDAIYSAVLELFPQIKRLYFYNKSKTSINVPLLDNKTEFDMLIYSLLLNNKETLSKLSGFEVVGFNILCQRTILLLKQYKFEKLGLLGLVSKADPFYLYSIFREETEATIAEIHHNLALKGLKLDKIEPFSEYNNLRNSVISISGTADIVSDAVNYRLIENLKRATAFVHRYNDNCSLYMEEELISKKYSAFKEVNENKWEMPLQLETLKIDPHENFLKECIPAQREQNKDLPQTIPLYEELKKKDNPSFYASKLLIETNIEETRDAVIMKAIGEFVVYDSTLEITATKYDNFYTTKTFLRHLESLKVTGKNLVVNFVGTDFLAKGMQPENNLIKCNEVEFMCQIHRAFFNYSDKNTLTFNFDLPWSYERNYVPRFKNQILTALNEKICVSLSIWTPSDEIRQILSEQVICVDSRNSNKF